MGTNPTHELKIAVLAELLCACPLGLSVLNVLHHRIFHIELKVPDRHGRTTKVQGELEPGFPATNSRCTARADSQNNKEDCRRRLEAVTHRSHMKGITAPNVGRCPGDAAEQQFGQFLEQAFLANEVFRFLVAGQQAGQQFFGYVVLLGVHCACGQAGLRRRWIVRLQNSAHPLEGEANDILAATRYHLNCPGLAGQTAGPRVSKFWSSETCIFAPC